MANQPLDKGRVCVIAEKYQTNQLDQNNQPLVKNRYATVGRATKWPPNQGSNVENIDLELDTMPIGATGPVKMYIFWESDNQNNQAGQQQGGGFNHGGGQQQGGHSQGGHPQY
jgi:hypothetical protein